MGLGKTPFRTHTQRANLIFSRREREGKYIFISPGLTLFAVYSGADGAVDDTRDADAYKVRAPPLSRAQPRPNKMLLFLSLFSRFLGGCTRVEREKSRCQR
jgi:hypothetical protein